MRIPPWTLVVGSASLLALLSQTAPTQLDQAIKLVDGTVNIAARRAAAAIVAAPPDELLFVDVVSAPLPVTVAMVMLCSLLAEGRTVAFVLGLGTLMGLCAIGERDADQMHNLIGGWIGLSATAALPWLVRATVTAVLVELLLAGEVLRVASCVADGCLERVLAGDFGTHDPVLIVAAFTTFALLTVVPWQACRFAYAQLRLDWLRWRNSGSIKPDAPLLSVNFKFGQNGHGTGNGGNHVHNF